MLKDYRNILGFILIIGGVLLGLQELGIISGTARDALFTAGFGLVAILFATIFFENRRQWWAILAALILFGLALTSGIDLFFPNLSENVGGPVFLFMIAIGFLVVYLVDHVNWWAIIPSGVLFSVGLVALADSLPNTYGFEPAGILFIGMGLTFLFLTFLSTNGTRLRWGIFPAIPLILFGIVIGLGSSKNWAILWPAMLIAAGIYFIFTTVRKPRT